MAIRLKVLTTVIAFVCVPGSALLDVGTPRQVLIESPRAVLWDSSHENQSRYEYAIENVVDETNTSLWEPRPKYRVTPIMFLHYRSLNESCTTSEEDFPPFFTDEQRKNGAVIVAILVGIYCFTLLAIICDNYFLPCVERICEALNLSQDVAAATFMAMATSAPELFVNIIGTFITESDIGIGAVVGSSMFNTLGVGAIGSLAASTPIKVAWWPVTRDSVLYLIAISLLVAMTWDGKIYWYEGLVLFIVYFLYFAIMFNNRRLSRWVDRLTERYNAKRSSSSNELTKSDEPVAKDDSSIYYIEDSDKGCTQSGEDNSNKSYDSIYSIEEDPKPKLQGDDLSSNSCEAVENGQEEESKVTCCSKLFRMPKGSITKKIFFIYTWPLKFLLYWTIPSPKTNPKFFPATFFMCILYLGGNSYIISWMISVIGHTFAIPEAILGLTFLAAGGCLPEAISITIMSRRGTGEMGVSNALGANTMNILLSLGLPWFIKTIILEMSGTPFLEIMSGSLEYTILGLMVVAFALYLTLFFNKFYLRRRTGVILSVIYLVFISAAVVAEMLLLVPEQCVS